MPCRRCRRENNEVNGARAMPLLTPLLAPERLGGIEVERNGAENLAERVGENLYGVLRRVRVLEN